MITTKRFSSSDNWLDIGSIERELEERGIIFEADSLSSLKELVQPWLCLGSEVVGVSGNHMLLKLWLLGDYHVVKFSGTSEEIHPLIRAAFAFAKAEEVMDPKDRSFPINSSDFCEFFGKKEIAEIVDVVWRCQSSLFNSMYRGNLAFLVGVGISPKDKLDLDIPIRKMPLDNLLVVAKFAASQKKQFGKFLKLLC